VRSTPAVHRATSPTFSSSRAARTEREGIERSGGRPGAWPEHGIRTFANAWVIANRSHENEGHGIRISSTDCLVEENSVADNDTAGIKVTSSGSLILRNKAAGNVDLSTGVTTDYDIVATSFHGPIVDVTGATKGDIFTVTNADHPQANFEY
jgi:parallel beta-helix repeat protein